MKKMIAAVTAGLLMVAGQAAAANNSATARVGDRVGAAGAESSEFGGVPLFAILIAAGAIALVVDGVNDDDSESD